LLEVQSVLTDFKKRAAKQNDCNVYSFGDDWKFAKKTAHRAALKDASENACRVFEDLVKENRILIQAEECKETHSGEPRDGSVSKNAVDGTVCISTDRLQTIPPGELRVQIPGLFLHEIMHLLGYHEDLAVYVQEYYLRDVAGGETWTPEYGKTPFTMRKHFPEYPPSKIKQILKDSIAESDRNREYFELLGIVCIDPSGIPRNLESFNELLFQPDSLIKLGLPAHGTFSETDRIAMQSMRMRARANTFGPPAKDLFLGMPDLSSNAEWVAKLKEIKKIVDSTYEIFESIYPTSGLALSVCEEALIQGRATLRGRLEEERYRQIQELLQFD